MLSVQGVVPESPSEGYIVFALSSLVWHDFQVNTGRAFPRIMRGHLAIMLTVAAFYLAGIAARHYFLDYQTEGLSFYVEPFGLLTGVFVFCFFLGHTLYVMAWVRPERLTAYIWSDLRERYLTPERLAQGLIMLLLMHPFISAFTSFKTLIPVIQPFYLDEFFMALDRSLHGGQDPWIWLHPLLGTPVVTFVVNFLYNLWFFVLFGVVFWQAFYQKDLVLRQQFFLTFLALWMFLGVVAAVALSSAGPVYYGRVTGLPDPYTPLMAYLNSANETYTLWSLKTQSMLWASYERGIAMAGSGISAMPSLHVATTTLFAIIGWNVNRLLGVILTIFALAILVGSVHLGWHYAVDGYLAIALTWSIWWAFGKVLRVP